MREQEHRVAVVLLKEARRHSDMTLVEECRKGDSEAFDELVRRYRDRVFNVIYRFVGNREDALDICQEAFVRAYRGIAGFHGGSQVSTWLHSIAANLARNRLRDAGRKGRNKGASLNAIDDRGHGGTHAPSGNEASPRDQAMSKEFETILQRCLTELPEHYRMTFVLRTMDDLSYEEIASVMGCPVGTVRSRLNQARKMLRDRLKELSIIS